MYLEDIDQIKVSVVSIVNMNNEYAANNWLTRYLD